MCSCLGNWSVCCFGNDMYENRYVWKVYNNGEVICVLVLGGYIGGIYLVLVDENLGDGNVFI